MSYTYIMTRHSGMMPSHSPLAGQHRHHWGHTGHAQGERIGVRVGLPWSPTPLRNGSNGPVYPKTLLLRPRVRRMIV